MSFSQFPSVFDSDPLSYRDLLQYVKDEPSEFIEYMDPFASPENSLDIFHLRQRYESDAIRSDSNPSASPASSSSFLTPGLLFSPNTSSLCSTRMEIDEAFINQTSCLSDAPSSNADTSSAASTSSPMLSQSSASSSKWTEPAIHFASTTSPIASQPAFSQQQKQIFSPTLPWVLHGRPVDAKAWVEWSGPVNLEGGSVHISGWEPQESDKYPLAEIDIEDWTPSAPMFLAIEQGLAKKPVSSGKPKLKGSPNVKSRSSEVSKTWGRRLASNRPAPEKNKRRRVETILSLDSQPVEERIPTPLFFLRRTGNTEPTSTDCEAIVQSAEEERPELEVSADKSDAVPQLEVPQFVYPQPDVAKAITQHAAKHERERGLAATAQWTEQTRADEEDEEARKLVEEFLDIPDEDSSNDGIGGGSVAKAFDLSRLPSPIATVITRHGVRATRSLLDYSSSTRRRALARFRSDVLPRGTAPIIQKFTGGSIAEEHQHESLSIVDTVDQENAQATQTGRTRADEP